MIDKRRSTGHGRWPYVCEGNQCTIRCLLDVLFLGAKRCNALALPATLGGTKPDRKVQPLAVKSARFPDGSDDRII
jgi:hypothetical protein